MNKLLLTSALLQGAAPVAQAQILTPVKWSYAARKTSATEAVVYLKATLDAGWHVYSQTGPAGGPVKTSISFAPAKGYRLVGTPQEPQPVMRYEPVFEMPVRFFEHSVIFQQKVKLAGPGPVTVRGSIHYMICNDTKCLPPADVAFSVPVK